MRTSVTNNRTRHTETWRGRLLTWLIGLSLCPLFAWLGIQAAYPFVTSARLGERNDDTQRQVLRLRLQNQRDEKSLVEFRTTQGIEDAARKNGWVMPGEQRLRLPQK